MLKLAVEAQLPLVFVNSREGSSYLPVVLQKTIGKPVERLDTLAVKGVLGKPDKPERVFYHRDKMPVSRRALFDLMAESGCTTILVDSDDSNFPGAVNLGDLKTPESLLVQSIAFFHADPAVVYPAIKGCSIVEAEALLKLTQARDKAITLPGLAQTRKGLLQASQGLYLVETPDELYVPPPAMVEWSELERDFFFKSDDVRLRPRGLLAVGPPGTGKTAFFRWLAREWGIPLYRLNIGTTKNEYVGMSERFLARAIAQVEEASPCLLLLDEVDKMFSDSQHDVTGRSMASQLLWWMSEHRHRVLTGMTCNNKAVLRPELYREGRIDKQIEFPNMTSQTQVVEFAKSVFKSFDCPVPMDITKLCMETMKSVEVSHARVIEIVKNRVKKINKPLLQGD